MSERQHDTGKSNRAMTSQMRAVDRVKGARPAGPVLVFLEADDLPRTVELSLDRRAYLVGRESDADIQICDDTVSREHAQFWVECSTTGEMKVKVRDLESTNGTLVNDQKVTEAELEPGDKIHLGDVVLRFDLLDSIDIEYHNRIAERLEKAAIDEATGLLRKGFFLDGLPALVEEWHRKEEDFVILVADIDNFKRINDEVGHAAGDRAIERVGRTIRQQIRERDVGIRYGGDEFVVVLPRVEIPEAMRVAQRVATAINGTTWESIAPGIPITLSQGLALSRPKEPLEEVFERADAALLRAKQLGRDRIEF